MNPTDYEAPNIERLGTVAELTEGGGFSNSDSHTTANDAFSNP